MILCLENGYSMIRIYQMDVLNDTINWKNELSNLLKVYHIPQIKYISSVSNLYQKEF